MKDKNFRVINSCRNCKYFARQGTRKQGYCIEGTKEQKMVKYISWLRDSWSSFVAIWNGQSFEEYIERYRHGDSYYYFGYYRGEEAKEQLRKVYDENVRMVEWWKENAPDMHMVHVENVCDLHEVKGRANSHASSKVKDPRIEWYDKLMNEES